MAENQLNQTGRTTRIIDKLIQQLFENGECIVQDHCQFLRADRLLLNRILKRLEHEHKHAFQNILVDKDFKAEIITIKLNNKQR